MDPFEDVAFLEPPELDVPAGSSGMELRIRC
jgi:hypothetical protein